MDEELLRALIEAKNRRRYIRTTWTIPRLSSYIEEIDDLLLNQITHTQKNDTNKL